MREDVILSETSRRFFHRESFLISGRDVKSKNLSCSVRDVRKPKGCHHELAPAAHGSFDPDVPAGRARDLLFAGTIADIANLQGFVTLRSVATKNLSS